MRSELFFSRLRVVITAFLLSLVAFAAVVPVCAQDTSKPPDQASQENKKPSPAIVVQKPVEGVSLLDEKSIIFPDIAASNRPLTAGEKFELFVDNSISVHTVLYSALAAGVGQADNSPTGWGQGWDAYGKRFGGSMASNASGEFFGTFILASAMHYDPRFFPDRDPSFGQAVGHSLKRIFVTKSDSGKQVMDVPGLVGPLLGEGLANVYWPDRNRTVGDTFYRYGIDIATRAGGNFLREYWPVVRAKFSHSGSAQSARFSETRTGQ
ncbi:MAG: hypothetical protein WA609_20175 [Terriglobales bacterium]